MCCRPLPLVAALLAAAAGGLGAQNVCAHSDFGALRLDLHYDTSGA
jgi:hypothetical protein